MKEAARGIIGLPFLDEKRRRHSYLTALDAIAVKAGKDQVYGLPGGSIEKGESPEEALRREIREEFGIQLGGLIKVGTFGRHHLFKAEPDISGIIRGSTVDFNEILGIGFLNAGRSRQIPTWRMQNHLRHTLKNLIGTHPELQTTDWPQGVDPQFEIRGYFFKGNKNKEFYDWEQQLAVIKKGEKFKTRRR